MLATVTVAALGVALGAGTASASSIATGRPVVADGAQAGTGAALTQASSDAVAAAAAYKAVHPLALAGAPSAAERAAAEAHDALKRQLLATATLSTQSSGQITWMYHYTQTTNYFCGPAVISEMSATVPGSSPYNLDQYAVAAYVGTTTDGTNYAQETNGLNHFVGVPDFGWNFYGMVWMSDPPTPAQQTTFLTRIHG